MIYIVATLEIETGTLDEVLQLAMPCVEETREETGCISYDLFQSRSDSDTLVFVERWEDRDAIKKHFNEAHLVKWRDEGARFIKNKKIEIIEPAKVDIL